MAAHTASRYLNRPECDLCVRTRLPQRSQRRAEKLIASQYSRDRGTDFRRIALCAPAARSLYITGFVVTGHYPAVQFRKLPTRHGDQLDATHLGSIGPSARCPRPAPAAPAKPFDAVRHAAHGQARQFINRIAQHASHVTKVVEEINLRTHVTFPGQRRLFAGQRDCSKDMRRMRFRTTAGVRRCHGRRLVPPGSDRHAQQDAGADVHFAADCLIISGPLN